MENIMYKHNININIPTYIYIYIPTQKFLLDIAIACDVPPFRRAGALFATHEVDPLRHIGTQMTAPVGHVATHTCDFSW